MWRTSNSSHLESDVVITRLQFILTYSRHLRRLHLMSDPRRKEWVCQSIAHGWRTHWKWLLGINCWLEFVWGTCWKRRWLCSTCRRAWKSSCRWRWRWSRRSPWGSSARQWQLQPKPPCLQFLFNSGSSFNAANFSTCWGRHHSAGRNLWVRAEGMFLLLGGNWPHHISERLTFWRKLIWDWTWTKLTGKTCLYCVDCSKSQA